MWHTVGRMPSACKRPHAADAQHDLLLDAQLAVAAVQRAGDLAVVGRVPGDVGIEQVQRNAPDLHLPDLRRRLPAGKIDIDDELLRRNRSFTGSNGQIVEVVDRDRFPAASRRR